MLQSTSPRSRKGAVIVLVAFMSIVLLGLVAFAVDVGHVLASKEELQRAADSAALAACWEYSNQLVARADWQQATSAARTVAGELALANDVANVGPSLDANENNAPDGDIIVGYVNDFTSSNATLDTTATNAFNAVTVRVRRNAEMNGQIPLHFARVFGLVGQSLEAEATAVMIRDVWGFEIPNGGGTVDILPFTLDEETWEALMAGTGDDEWTYHDDGTVSSGGDYELECNLYPQGINAPGNRGTLDIGSASNSTADISRQILQGLSESDLAYHGGTLEFINCDGGMVELDGDTGISAGFKEELTAIKGQPRVIPIFSSVRGPGNNAIYTIVKWVGVRIMDVKLNGPMKKKHVTIQPCPIVCKGVIPSTITGTSDFVYSPAILMR